MRTRMHVSINISKGADLNMDTSMSTRRQVLAYAQQHM